MKETGIIMSGNHPKLILDGIKTMTRRTYGLEKINIEPDKWNLVAVFQDGLARFFNSETDEEITLKSPYGGVGDRLWVRATWAKNYKGQMLFKYQYHSLTEMLDLPAINIKWKPSIHLHKEDAEIWLEITGLRAERVQEISVEDCISEGYPFGVIPEGLNQTQIAIARVSRRGWFQSLWGSLNAKRGYGWETNPWVWVIGFKVVLGGKE